jgi:glycosyltransferase involved in cell wall biosynthesis
MAGDKGMIKVFHAPTISAGCDNYVMQQAKVVREPIVSIVIPAKNEASNLARLLPEIRGIYPDTEILVVDDGSTDNTAEICAGHAVKVIRQPYSMGNGAAVKAGARAASGEILVFMDGDGQHNPADIPRLLETLREGYAMVVGARGFETQATVGRGIANTFYNRLASWMVGHRVMDLTSGLRAVHANKFREFLHLLPNGFSYPTTSTMAFFRAGYPVAYLPIRARQRQGKSHIRPVKDGVRFMLIIFRIGTLYSPLKLFSPISLGFFLVGLGYYIYTLITIHRFTNMSALMFTTSITIFLIGLVSEQITNLLYKHGPDQ